MAFVFEARRLPFSHITEEAYAASRDALLGSTNATAGTASAIQSHLASLPLWDRCMLLAVLPLVLEARRREAAAAAAAPHSEEATEGDNGVSDAVDAGEWTDPGDESDVSRVATSSLRAGTLDAEDVVLAMRMVRALDELEVAWDHIRAVRNGDGGDDAQGQKRGGPTKWTDEELMMEMLLAERGAGGFLREQDDESSAEEDTEKLPADKESGDEAIDIAMCFDRQGNSIGIGSAGVYGGHGYHLLEE